MFNQIQFNSQVVVKDQMQLCRIGTSDIEFSQFLFPSSSNGIRTARFDNVEEGVYHSNNVFASDVVVVLRSVFVPSTPTILFQIPLKTFL